MSEDRNFLDEILEAGERDDPRFRELVDASIRQRTAMRRLKAARESAGLTQQQLAEKMLPPTTQSVIARLEAGDGDPQLSTVLRWLHACGKRLVIADA